MADDITHEEVVGKIINVLQKFGSHLILNRRSVRQDNMILSEYTFPYLNAVQNRGDLYDMLRKLNDSAILEMYNNCRNLAKKYEWSIIDDMPDSVTLYSPLYIRNLGFVERKRSDGVTVGWGYYAPQERMGFSDRFDEITPGLNFDIHATKFMLNGGQQVLRLWKGFYWSCIGGEIGFYGKPRKVSYKDLFGKLKEAVQRFLEIVGARAVAGDIITLPQDEMKERLVEYAIESKEIMPFVQAALRKNELKQFLLKSLMPEATLDRAFLTAFFGIVSPLAVVPAAVVAYAFVTKLLILIKFILMMAIEMGVGLWLNSYYPKEWEPSLSSEELSDGLGLTGTAIQVRYKFNDYLIAERREFQPRFWTNAFEVSAAAVPEYLFSRINTRNFIYTKNYFFFRNRQFADRFHVDVRNRLGDARDYFDNIKEDGKETINIPDKPSANTVIIYYGK